ncbi:MAG: hypothetical protein HYX80_04530 [Chloroflexi bacterium]|nr:hypothetical protein [Chloroflexota bacterium]
MTAGMRRLSTLSVFLLLVPLFAGCSRYYSYEQLSQGTELDFNNGGTGGHLIDRDGESRLIGKAPRIFIMTDNQSLFAQGLENIYGLQFINSHVNINTDNKGDFSNSFLLVAFQGRREHPNDFILITDVWQNKSTVYVRAQFYDAELSEPVTVEHGTYVVTQRERLPYSAIIVSKAKMPQYGRLIFRLVDDYGREKAMTTAVIPLPKGQER